MKRKRPLAAMLATISALLIVAGYFTAYYALCKSVDDGLFDTSGTAEKRIRVFKARWQAAIFMPAAKIESWVIGHSVVTDADHDDPFG